MLQQTQVPRVLEKYKEFLKRFPNIRALAKAPLSDVLKVWSGLGYNRRGKYLHDTAKAIVQKHKGIVPKDVHELRALPGMGPYTASAVRVFAYNLPDILLETNVRAVFIHHFFRNKENVRDSDLIPIATLASQGVDPRTWHWALMDFGVYIKKLHKNPTRHSAHYVVQTKFHGSLRQIRGAILKVLTEGAHGDLAISKKLDFDDFYVRKALADLKKDGLITSEKGSWRIA
ncbi:MAG TPA: A/G-specific adenine glycosylase [Candidatus Paceibacterota bacterium]|nr:A/G-specific adenine glycosylase [Candidatus Paceibacterota bacterium]